MNIYDSNGRIKSNTDPTKYLTFEYWIYMVPQFKPKSVLMLGVAGATTAGLIRKIYGDEVEITGVDIVLCESRYGIKFIQADAKEFIKTCKHFDCVLVDVFPENENAVCDFVTTPEFAQNLAKIADYIIINTVLPTDLSAYNFLEWVTTINPPGLRNKVYYFAAKKIPDLFPFPK
jgi:hypothetical protein